MNEDFITELNYIVSSLDFSAKEGIISVNNESYNSGFNDGLLISQFRLELLLKKYNMREFE